MVPQIKKILFTTDLSKESRQAFDYAVSLAVQYGATITILYVMEESGWSSKNYAKTMLGEDRWEKLRESQEQEARQILIGKKKEGAIIREALTEFCKAAEKDYQYAAPVLDDIVVARGMVVDEILQTVEERQCNLIVMGYHGRGQVEEAILGSTTRRLLRRSKVPVLLVRMTSGEQ